MVTDTLTRLHITGDDVTSREGQGEGDVTSRGQWCGGTRISGYVISWVREITQPETTQWEITSASVTTQHGINSCRARFAVTERDPMVPAIASGNSPLPGAVPVSAAIECDHHRLLCILIININVYLLIFFRLSSLSSSYVFSIQHLLHAIIHKNIFYFTEL